MPRETQHEHEQGQALLEFALTVPILLMFVFGIIDVARVLFGLSQVVDASRQAVRYGLVEGLNVSDKQYLDCEGIQNAALNLPGVINLGDATVSVYYEDTEGHKIADCHDGLTNWDVTNGDVLAVRVQGGVQPVTPVLMAFTDNISFSYTSRRTIVLEGSAYTEEWPEPPPAAENFRAVVDCSQTSNNVSFYWNAFSPIPDRAEIRNSLTGEVVVTLDTTEPGLIDNAFCEDCATISPDGGYGMYYLVAINGTAPSELAGPTSNDAVVMCTSSLDASYTPLSDESGHLVVYNTIKGLVYNDTNNNGRLNNEPGIGQVAVYLYDAGADGILGNSDDGFQGTSTLSDGTFSFSVPVPYGLTGQNYKLSVVTTSAALQGKILTTNNNPLSIYVAAGNTSSGNEFGFNCLCSY